MIPAAFEYHAPSTIDEATALLVQYDGEAKVLSGGQSLVPMLNMRLARPAVRTPEKQILVGLERLRSRRGRRL
jgi:carbon-monoxide dehydrogenase medium subunit